MMGIEGKRNEQFLDRINRKSLTWGGIKIMTDTKKDKLKELRAFLSTMNESQRQAFVSKYGFVSIESHSYSLVNQCLIAFQYPQATILGGYQQFRKANRQVKQGEHGLVIFYPSARKNDETGEDDISFYVGTIFDISQTYEVK